MSYFFDRIMNESYAYGNSISSRDMYEIESQVTDDPISMYNYTSECVNNIYKTDAAYAKFESMNIVAALEARSVGDNYRMQQISVAMEGAFGDMVEKIKEWISKAYNAVKNFLKKCWTKIKARIDIIRGQIGKYEDVLKNRDLSGCKVNWIKYNPQDVFGNWQELDKKIDTDATNLKNTINGLDNKDKLNAYKKSFPAITGNNEYTEAAISKKIALAGLVDKTAIDKNNKPKDNEVEFNEIAEEVFSFVGKNPEEEFNKQSLGGENALKAALKDLEEAGKKIKEDREKEKENEKSGEEHEIENLKNQICFDLAKSAHTYRVGIYRRFSSRLNEVLNARTAQAVAACKKAITYAHEKNRPQKKEKKPDNSSYIFNVSSFNDMLNYV